MNTKSLNNIKILFSILILIFTVCGNNTYCKASSASINFSLSEDEIKVGDKFTVIMTIDTNSYLGEINAYISYNSNYLEFLSDSEVITGGDGLLQIHEPEVDEAEDVVDSEKYVLKFKAIADGTSKIGLSEMAKIYDWQDETEMSVSSNNLTITVDKNTKYKDPEIQITDVENVDYSDNSTQIIDESKSRNNNLYSLEIENIDLNIKFDPEIINYSAIVDNNIRYVNINAKTQDADAVITILGNEKLEVGENEIVIIVTAPSGDIKKYYVNIERLESENVTNNTTKELGVDVVTIDNVNYINTTTKLQILNIDENTIIPDGYIKTKLILDGKKITAYTLEDDLGNDFLLIYGKTDNTKAQFYKYDRKDKTLQRYNSGEIQTNGKGYTITKTPSTDERKYKIRIEQLTIMIGILAGLIGMLLIALITCFMKVKGYKNDLD